MTSVACAGAPAATVGAVGVRLGSARSVVGTSGWGARRATSSSIDDVDVAEQQGVAFVCLPNQVTELAE